MHARKREREKKRRPLHIKRVQAEIRVISGKLGQPAIITQARLVLNDISAQGVGLFAVEALTPGQTVAITLEDPYRFYVKGRVVWCQENDPESHVIHQQNFGYRVGVQFLIETPEETADVQKFLRELAEKHLFKTAA
jgi:hypothetical protein